MIFIETLHQFFISFFCWQFRFTHTPLEEGWLTDWLVGWIGWLSAAESPNVDDIAQFWAQVPAFPHQPESSYNWTIPVRLIEWCIAKTEDSAPKVPPNMFRSPTEYIFCSSRTIVLAWMNWWDGERAIMDGHYARIAKKEQNQDPGNNGFWLSQTSRVWHWKMTVALTFCSALLWRWDCLYRKPNFHLSALVMMMRSCLGEMELSDVSVVNRVICAYSNWTLPWS